MVPAIAALSRKLDFVNAARLVFAFGEKRDPVWRRKRDFVVAAKLILLVDVRGEDVDVFAAD